MQGLFTFLAPKKIESQRHTNCSHYSQNRIAQLTMCLTADPGVASLILDQSHSFVEINHEIISMAILLSYTDSKRVVVSHKHKFVRKVLVNCLVKVVQEKSVVRRTDHCDMTITVDWDVKH